MSLQNWRMGEWKRWILNQWYWIMPNKVLFDKKLKDKQKLLYCLISSLCAEKWFCWASNKYLWEMLWSSERTISEHISDLIELWYIETQIKNWNQRQIMLKNSDSENSLPPSENSLPSDSEKLLHNITTTNITNNNYSFQDFRKEFPHARKWKKADSEKYFKQNDSDSVKKQVSILNRSIKAWLQDAEYVPACERRIRDFTPLSEDVIKQKLIKICKRHLNAWWDLKQRALELKQTFWEQKINEIVKAIQQKDSPKNLFLKQNQ